MHTSLLSSVNKRVTAELLAFAVSRLFPTVTLIGGGINKLGFFYDFIFQQTLPTDAQSLIEVELRTLLKENLPIRFAHMMRENAENFFNHHDQSLLALKVAAEPSNIVELLQIDRFTGICPACAITSTGEVTPYAKILEVATIEFNCEGEEHAAIRIIGNCFANPQELKVYAKLYDKHRKKANHVELGQELNLFIKKKYVSDLEFIWLPKGIALRQTLKNWVKPYFLAKKTEWVKTPTLTLRRTKKNPESFLYVNFHEDLYQLTISRLRAHSEILLRKNKNKMELPLSVAEYGQSYQMELDSELNGLLAYHSSYADHMTICCKRKEASKEIISFLLFIEQIIKIFSFEAHWCLITSSAKSAKAKAEKEAIEILVQAVQHSFFPFQEERVEEDALVGPRLELRITDKLQRAWSCSTVSIVVHEFKILDLFKEQVKDKECLADVPLLIQQSLWGSLDRIIALLIEQYEGQLPFWLVPEQVRLLVIGKNALTFAQQVAETCEAKALRIAIDARDIKLSEKIHDVGREKIPVTVVIGENETNKKCLTVQHINRSGKSQVLSLDEFLSKQLLEAECPILK